MKLKGPAPFIVPPRDSNVGDFWAGKKATPKPKRDGGNPAE